MTLTREALRELAEGAIAARHTGYRAALQAVGEMQRSITPEMVLDLLRAEEIAIDLMKAGCVRYVEGRAPESESPFCVGDVVVRKGLTRPMRIIAIYEQTAICAWYCLRGDRMSGELLLDDLELVPDTYPFPSGAPPGANQ